MSEGRSYTTAFGAYTKGFEEGIDRMNNALKDYQKQLKNNKKEQTAASREIKAYQKELDALEEEIKQNGEATEKQKQRQKELNDKIKEAKQRLDDLKIAQAGLRKEIEDAKKKIEEQKKAVETFKNSMSDAKDSAKELGTEIAGLAAAGTAAIAGMIAYGRQASQWADDLNTLSKTTGIATADLQKFQYAEKLVDVSTETLTGSLTKLTSKMADAAEDDTGKAAESFEKLNVKVTDSTGKIRDRQEVFYEIIDALGKVGNEVERDALAMDIFGKSAQQLNPLIKGGAQVLKSIGDELDRSGLILSQDELDKLNQFNDKIDTLTAKGSQIQKITAGQVTPAVDGLLDVADELLDDIKQMADSGELKDIAESWGVTIRKGAADLKNLVLWVTKHKEAVAGAAGAMAGYKIGLSIGSLVNSLCAGMSALKAMTDSETASQIALNTAMNSNPIGVVIGLVGALTGGLIAMSAASSSAADDVEVLNSALDRAASAYASSAANTQAEAAYIKSLGEEYEKLRTKSELTAGEREKLAAIAETLQNKLGLEAAEVKNTAGEYQYLTDKINETIEAMKAQAAVEAAAEGYKSALQTQLEARLKFEQKLAEVRKKYPSLYDEKGNLNGNEWNNDTNDAVNEVEDLRSAWMNAGKAVEFYSDRMGEAVADQDTFLGKSSSSGASIENTTNVIKGSADAVGDYTDQIEEYADRLLKGEDGFTLQGFYSLFQSTGDAAQYLEDKLQSSNKALEDNRTQIKNTQDEIERLRKALNKPDITPDDFSTKYTQLEDAKKRLAQLRTEQVGLKEAVKSAEKEYKSASWAAKSYDEKISELAKDSADVRKQLKSLSDIYGELQNGQDMSFDTLLSLIEKYPQYASELANANGNISEQKRLVELLYEAEKNEAVAKLTNAKAAAVAQAESKRTEISTLRESISSTERYINVLKNLNLTHLNVYSSAVTNLSRMRGELSNLNTEFDNAKLTADSYNDAINALSNAFRNFNIRSSNNNNTSADNNYSPSQSSSGSDNVEWTWSWLDEQATGSSSSQARTELVERVHSLGKINDRELKAEYEKILREEANTYEESYNLRLKLKNVTDRILNDEVKAKEEAEKKKEEAEKQRLAILKREQELASAAYKKLVEGEISSIQGLNKAIQAGADNDIKKIDKQMEKRRQKKEDDNRKKELDAIELQLKYYRGDDNSRASLEQRRQEILNEQAEADYERQMEQKKLDIQARANTMIDSNTSAIEKLTAVMEDVSYRLASSHTAQEVVSQVTDKRELVEMFKTGTNNMSSAQIQAFIQAVKADFYSG